MPNYQRRLQITDNPGQPATKTTISEPPAVLPTKEFGKHRWVLMAAYTVESDALAKAWDKESPVPIGAEQLVNMAIGCIDCEEVYDRRIAGQPCPALATDWPND